jgi:hypothetical protein
VAGSGGACPGTTARTGGRSFSPQSLLSSIFIELDVPQGEDPSFGRCRDRVLARSAPAAGWPGPARAVRRRVPAAWAWWASWWSCVLVCSSSQEYYRGRTMVRSPIPGESRSDRTRWARSGKSQRGPAGSWVRTRGADLETVRRPIRFVRRPVRFGSFGAEPSWVGLKMPHGGTSPAFTHSFSWVGVPHRGLTACSAQGGSDDWLVWVAERREALGDARPDPSASLNPQPLTASPPGRASRPDHPRFVRP